MRLQDISESLRSGSREFLPAQETLNHALGRYWFMLAAAERYPDMIEEFFQEVYS